MAKRQSLARQWLQPSGALRRATAISKAKSTYKPEMATTICAMIGAGMALGEVADWRGMPCVARLGCAGEVVIIPSASRPRARHGAEPRPRCYHSHNFLVTVA